MRKNQFLTMLAFFRSQPCNVKLRKTLTKSC